MISCSAASMGSGGGGEVVLSHSGEKLARSMLFQEPTMTEPAGTSYMQ